MCCALRRVQQKIEYRIVISRQQKQPRVWNLCTIYPRRWWCGEARIDKNKRQSLAIMARAGVESCGNSIEFLVRTEK